MSPRAPHDDGESESIGETLDDSGSAGGEAASRSRGRRSRSRERRRQRPARRHPDIEVARLLVKRGLIAKAPTVEALRTQKARAKAGKARIPFLQLLVRTGVLPRERVGDAQDEIRANTYICEACDARAVILAGSQTRAGACPRCGHEISVDPQTDPQAVPAREFQGTDATQGSEATEAAKWRGGPPGLVGNAAARRLEPGTLVFEKYLLKDELGRGAMGVVFRARHLGLNKDVALKVLVPTDDNREHQVARFRREAAAVQKLRHDGIIAVHDFGGDGDLYYLTMDLVEGGESLHRVLKRRDEPMPLRRRLELMVQVGHAVGHAHGRGVVHRDLKPANVLIDPSGRALVADFGLAKDEDDDAAELTRTHDRLGTPLFMAPEQIRRGAAQVDGRADVWALGVMLFVCATGRYPFRSRTVMDLYLRIMKDDPDWTGTKYSAPDRPGADWLQADVDRAAVTDKDASAKEGSATRTSERRGGSVIDENEATEVDADRVRADGSLPRTLPLGRERGVTPLTPPPFAPPPDLPAGQVPPDLRRIIECALSKEPDDRYATAEELALDLERFLSERPVEARTPSLTTRLKRALGRKRVIARVALAATLVAVGLGVLLGVQAWRREADRRVRQQVDALWTSTGAQGGFEAYLEQLGRAPDLADRADATLHRGAALTRLLRFDEAGAALDAAARAAEAAGDDGLQARVAVERAHLALVAGDARAALEHALAALAHDLPDPRPPLYAGAAALRLADPAALARADAVVAPAAARPGAAPQLVACAARLALARGELEAARDRLPAPQPDEWFDLTLCRAAIALSERDVATAARLFEAVRDQFRFRVLRDRDPEVSYYNGLGYSKLEDRALVEALRADRAAAALSPWHPGPVYYAGRVVLGGYADPQGALPDLREALRRDPFHPQARELALAIATAGPAPDLEAALALAAEARELLPADPGPILLAAALELRAGRPARTWTLVDELEARGGVTPDALGPVALLRAAALRRATEAARDDLARRAGGATFEVAPRAGSWLEATLRVEVARADLDAGEPSAALELVEPLLDAARTSDLAQDGARVVAARALAALGERKAAVDLLRWFLPWRPLRPLPPDMTPEALRAFPELQPLRGEAAFQEVVTELEARRKAPRP